MIRISKKLLSEVLNLKQEIKSIILDDINVVLGLGDYLDNDQSFDEFDINIYELAYKYKEWALAKGFKINSRLTGKDKNYAEILSCKNSAIIAFFYEDTESEAIFKACEWILENKEDK